MSYVAIWLQTCLHWRCAYFQTLPWNDTIIVVDWDILYKLCGSTNKWSKGFVFSGKIRWQFYSCNKACSDYRIGSTITPKYTLPQRLVYFDSWACWQSFVSTCDVFKCLFPLNVQNEIQLLSRVFCYSWLVCLVGFWLRNTSLVKVGNPIS